MLTPFNKGHAPTASTVSQRPTFLSSSRKSSSSRGSISSHKEENRIGGALVFALNPAEGAVST